MRMAANLYGYTSTKANAIHSVEFLAHKAKVQAEQRRLDDLDKAAGRNPDQDNFKNAIEKYAEQGKKIDAKILKERARLPTINPCNMRMDFCLKVGSINLEKMMRLVAIT